MYKEAKKGGSCIGSRWDKNTWLPKGCARFFYARPRAGLICRAARGESMFAEADSRTLLLDAASHTPHYTGNVVTRALPLACQRSRSCDLKKTEITRPSFPRLDEDLSGVLEQPGLLDFASASDENDKDLRQTSILYGIAGIEASCSQPHV